MSIAHDLAAKPQTAFNARDEAGLRALWTDDFHFIGPATEFRGAERMLEQERNLWAAFPDVRSSVRVVCAEGDVVVFETTMTGTHTGPLRLGERTLAPSGRPVDLRIAVHLFLKDGRVCGERAFLDQLGLLQQIGALPALAPAA